MALAVVVVLGSCLLFAGVVAADHATTDELPGDGSEDSPYQISDVHELQAMEEDLSAHYVLVDDVDATETETWEGGAGFDPVGDRDDYDPFTGSFDGNGYTISNLKIDRPSEEGVGPFGFAHGSVEDVHLENADVSGGEYVGAVVGHVGVDEHEDRVGTVRSVSVVGQVQATDSPLGGLVGMNDGTVDRASVTGAVEGTDRMVGGLIGWNDGSVSESYVAGTVEGDTAVGGVAGLNEGPIRASFFAGDVEGETHVGGLAGDNRDAFNDAYAHSHVEGEYGSGGLFGTHSGTVTGAYAAGSISSETDAGGLVGNNEGIVNDAYWDIETTGQRYPFGVDEAEAAFDDDDEIDVTSLETDELTGTEVTSTTDLDFDSPWQTDGDYPRFQWEDDRDVSDEAYDVSIEPVELEQQTKEPETGAAETGDEDGSLTDELPGFGAVVTLVAVVVATALVGRRTA